VRRTLPLKLLAAAALAAVAVLLPRRTHRLVLERSQLVPARRDDVFSFFADPRNLPEITPPWIRFAVLHLEAVPLAAGITNEYRIRWLGLPLRWRSLIVEYEPPARFTDLQTSGPYRYWRHQHIFEERDGATLATDRVEYEMPFGVVGRLLHALVVTRQLRQIFDYRAEATERAFATP
jgi:ligand-binding SRPBCC domain-containing protein